MKQLYYSSKIQIYYWCFLCTILASFTSSIYSQTLPDQFPLRCPSNMTVSGTPGHCSGTVDYTLPGIDGGCENINLAALFQSYIYIGSYNGHSYYYSKKGMLWTDAKVAAEQLGAHLATIASAGENDFINVHAAVFNTFNNVFWVGGFQNPNSTEPGEGWQWVDGTPWNYANWYTGEPNDFGGENYLEFYSNSNTEGKTGGSWNDLSNLNLPSVIEFDCYPFQVQLVSGLSSGSVFPLGDNNISYQITDPSGNVSTCNFKITQLFSPLTSSTTITNVSCFGSATGSVTISASGGTPPYTGTGTTSNLAAGNYSYTVTDAKGCTTNGSYTITQPATALSGSTVVTNVSCFGSATGSVVISATGGTPPYVGTGTTNHLSAGTYSYTITDAKGCSVDGSFIVSQPSAAFNVVKETFPNQFNTGFSTSLSNKTFVGSSGTWTANSNSNGSVAVLQPYYSPSSSYAVKILNFKTKSYFNLGTGYSSATSPKLNLNGSCCPTDVKLNFTLWTYSCVSGDTKASLGIDFSNDNGSTWTEVWSKTSAQLYSSYGSNGKTNISINVPAIYQNSSFKYRIRGEMDSNDPNNFYVFLDDIDVTSCAPAAPSGSTIGNYVWNDLNCNGIQDPKEPGIPGVTVKLTKIGGSSSTTTTDANGNYSFTNLSSGIYLVNFDTPDGFIPSASNKGSNDALDNDAVYSYVLVSLQTNQINNTIDAGFTNHSTCKNNCTHNCTHSNCGVNHSSCRNNCFHTNCNHANCGNHSYCRNNCNHKDCGHRNCGNSYYSGYGGYSYGGYSAYGGYSVNQSKATTESSEESSTTEPPASNNASDKVVKADVVTYDHLAVKVMPNPSIQDFTLVLNGKPNVPITVRIADMNGRLINTFANLQSGNTLKYGIHLAKGVYIAEVMQGEERKIIKLIKL